MANAGRYRLQYAVVGFDPRIVYPSYLSSEYTIRNLLLRVNYSINISVAISYRQYTGGNCYSQYLYGDYSDTVYNVTNETGTYREIFILLIVYSLSLCRFKIRDNFVKN